MKIGVSGASGHLGKAVVLELLQRPGGHEVVAITRTPETISRDRLTHDSETTTSLKALRRPMQVSIVCSSSRPSPRSPESAGRRTSLPSMRP
jgi:uncharacterized protein YbjT (DUF2867 family)